MKQTGSVAESISAERLVKAVISDFPDHKAGTRPVHTVGIGVTGEFIPSEAAPQWCRAAQFRGPVPISVRFSNGSGSPVQHDGWSDARGMATRFHLPDGSSTDLIAMTLREFFTATVDEFLAFSAASQMAPVSREGWLAKLVDMLRLEQPLADPKAGETMSAAAGTLAFANDHSHARQAAFDAGSLGAPVSYARAVYHAVHTFIVTAPNGARRAVRFRWRPAAGVKLTDPTQPPVDVYLQDELRTRIRRWPVEFLLEMVIGEAGDALADPSRSWPLRRRRVVMGALRLTEVPEDQVEHCERLAFNPCRLTDGIDLSDDPILAARRDAYEWSREQRGGVGCPFARSPA